MHYSRIYYIVIAVQKTAKMNVRKDDDYERKSCFSLLRRIRHHSDHPVVKEIMIMKLSVAASTADWEEELDGLEERAKLSGASKLYIEDITDEFCDDYIVPCVQAGAVYENKYLLGTSMARPGIAKKLVEVARKRRCYCDLPRRYRKRK